jgi:hypothetical protein
VSGITPERALFAHRAEMILDLEQRAEALLAESAGLSTTLQDGNQTRKSEILEEMLALVARTLEAKRASPANNKHGRWL